MERTLLLSSDKVSRMISRLAYEIVERNRGAENVVILGMRTRGVALAERIATEIGQIEQRTFTVGRLDVGPYRDDKKFDEMLEDGSLIPEPVTDKDVIVVDDVLFTGRTARAALDALVHYGRPKTIQLVILIDRGHREYPIQPDYVGRLVQTKHTERVVVSVDEGFAVFVEE